MEEQSILKSLILLGLDVEYVFTLKPTYVFV